MDIHQTEQYQNITNRIHFLRSIGKKNAANVLQASLDSLVHPNSSFPDGSSSNIKFQQAKGDIQNTFEGITRSKISSSDSVNNTGVEIKEELRSITELINCTLDEIRTLTGLKATLSIRYDAITIDWVKKRLIADNLRMENIALNISLGDTERFYTFCTNAFYQIENLLNYYYYLKYPKFDDCISYFKSMGTKFENGDPRKLADIRAHSKLLCFENEFYYDKSGSTFYDSKLELIKYVRNMDEHRCDVYVQDFNKHRAALEDLIARNTKAKEQGITLTESKKDKDVRRDGRIANFLKEHNFDVVRQEVSLLYDKVSNNLPK